MSESQTTPMVASRPRFRRAARGRGRAVLQAQAGGDEHGARDALEVGPARGDADQLFGVLGQIAGELRLEFGRDGMDGEGGELGSSGEQPRTLAALLGSTRGIAPSSSSEVGTPRASSRPWAAQGILCMWI